MKNKTVLIIILMIAILHIVNSKEQKLPSDYEAMSLIDLLLERDFFFRIVDKDTGRYVGYIANNHGSLSSGYEGEYLQRFIYIINKVDDEFWDIYIQNTGSIFDEEKEYYNWIFPYCYKVVLTKKDIINKLQNPEKIADLFCDRSIKYPTSCHALVITENLRIRSEPSVTSNSKILGKYEKFASIILYESTADKNTIDGLEAPWYKVKLKDGTEGWVFGGYVRIYFRETDIEMIKKAFSNSL